MAIGVLKRDRGRAFDGVLIEHDLNEQCVTEIDAHLTGKDVVDTLIENVARDVLVLVHSGNRMEAPKLVARLMAQGFPVDYVPFDPQTFGSSPLDRRGRGGFRSGAAI
jgi:hypothetical protein